MPAAPTAGRGDRLAGGALRAGDLSGRPSPSCIQNATLDTVEPFDAIVELGIQLGRFQKGRGQLPHRLRADRASRGGAFRSRPSPVKAIHLCPPNLCDPLAD